MKSKLDIIDLLDDAESYVRLVLKNGQIEYGYPESIVYWEDEEGWDTIKKILFSPFYAVNQTQWKYYGLEDIESFEPVKEEDIPPHE